MIYSAFLVACLVDHSVPHKHLHLAAEDTKSTEGREDRVRRW